MHSQFRFKLCKLILYNIVVLFAHVMQLLIWYADFTQKLKIQHFLDLKNENIRTEQSRDVAFEEESIKRILIRCDKLSFFKEYCTFMNSFLKCKYIFCIFCSYSQISKINNEWFNWGIYACTPTIISNTKWLKF